MICLEGPVSESGGICPGIIRQDCKERGTYPLHGMWTSVFAAGNEDEKWADGPWFHDISFPRENSLMDFGHSRGNWLAGRGSLGIGVFTFKGYRVVIWWLCISHACALYTIEGKYPNTARTSAGQPITSTGHVFLLCAKKSFALSENFVYSTTRIVVSCWTNNILSLVI